MPYAHTVSLCQKSIYSLYKNFQTWQGRARRCYIRQPLEYWDAAVAYALPKVQLDILPRRSPLSLHQSQTHTCLPEVQSPTHSPLTLSGRSLQAALIFECGCNQNTRDPPPSPQKIANLHTEHKVKQLICYGCFQTCREVASPDGGFRHQERHQARDSSYLKVMMSPGSEKFLNPVIYCRYQVSD